MAFTQLHPHGAPGQPYGGFAGKGVASPGPLTQLTPSAIPGQRYHFTAKPPSGFPAQFGGLRTFYDAAIKDLCLVAEADGHVGMGGIPVIDKNGTKYAIYLVDTTDPMASHVRIRTTTGTKSIRLKD